MLPLKAVLFDLDGTLLDSLPLTITSFQEAIYRVSGKRPTPEEVVSRFGPGELQIFEAMIGQPQGAAAWDIYREIFAAGISSLHLFDGIEDVLSKLRKHSIQTAIITGRGRVTTQMIARQFNFDSIFPLILTHDDVEHGKPAPDGILKACRHFNLDPQDAAYCGDSAVDIQSAHHAGTMSLAALWNGGTDREELLLHSPDQLLEEPGRIVEIALRGRSK